MLSAYTGPALSGYSILGDIRLCSFSTNGAFDTNSATKEDNCRGNARQRIAMGWKLLIGFVGVLILVAGGLAWYGSVAGPRTHTVEQVIPDAKLPK